jgi:hypothetical protein
MPALEEFIIAAKAITLAVIEKGKIAFPPTGNPEEVGTAAGKVLKAVYAQMRKES